MFYNVYTVLKQRLNTIAGAKNVAWYTPGATIHATPALYIEFLPAKTETLGVGNQQAELRVNIHTVTSALSEMDGDIKDAQLQLHSELDQEVYDKIQGFGQRGTFDSLQQAAYRVVPTDKAMIHTVQEFYSSTYRGKTPTTQTGQTPQPNVSVRG